MGGELIMSLKNNIDEQREYLQKNLEQINTVVGALLGVRTHLEIIEKKDYKGETYFRLEDPKNYRDCCGIMAKAFEKVIINTFSMWFGDQGVSITMHFSYDHIGGGSNGAEFCRLDIINDFVKIR